MNSLLETQQHAYNYQTPPALRFICVLEDCHRVSFGERRGCPPDFQGWLIVVITNLSVQVCVFGMERLIQDTLALCSKVCWANANFVVKNQIPVC